MLNQFHHHQSTKLPLNTLCKIQNLIQGHAYSANELAQNNTAEFIIDINGDIIQTCTNTESNKSFKLKNA